jgi:hypothetical protein
MVTRLGVLLHPISVSDRIRRSRLPRYLNVASSANGAVANAPTKRAIQCGGLLIVDAPSRFFRETRRHRRWVGNLVAESVSSGPRSIDEATDVFGRLYPERTSTLCFEGFPIEHLVVARKHAGRPRFGCGCLSSSRDQHPLKASHCCNIVVASCERPRCLVR